MSRTNNLSGSVANDLSGFMISLEVQGGGHETDEIATGAFDGTSAPSLVFGALHYLLAICLQLGLILVDQGYGLEWQ